MREGVERVWSGEGMDDGRGEGKAGAGLLKEGLLKDVVMGMEAGIGGGGLVG